MDDRPKAKLVRHIPSGKRLQYWDKWEYECVDCGSIYSRSANNSRINPYCGMCARKHDAERQKELKIKKQQEHDAKVKRDTIDEFLQKLKERNYKDWNYATYEIMKEIAEKLKERINA